jgi:hypothetical protein
MVDHHSHDLFLQFRETSRQFLIDIATVALYFVGAVSIFRNILKNKDRRKDI